jgi:hypothetical protein
MNTHIAAKEIVSYSKEVQQKDIKPNSFGAFVIMSIIQKISIYPSTVML